MTGKAAEYFRSRYKMLLPFILAFTINSAMLSIYSINFISKWNILNFVICAVCFFVCDLVDKRKILMLVFYVIVVGCSMSQLVKNMNIGLTDDRFRAWFLTGSDNVATTSDLVITMVGIFCPLLSVIIYYYTVKYHRIFMLTVSSMLPFVLSVKTLSEIDSVYICVIAVLNVSIMLVRVRSEETETSKTAGARSAATAIGVFTFLVLVISAAIPKNEEAPYFEVFERAFMQDNNSRELGSDYTQFSEFSGNADNADSFTNRLMYSIYAENYDNAPYMKRQVFDYYDFENDRWYSEKEYSTAEYSQDIWYQSADLLSQQGLLDAMAKAEEYEEGFWEKYNISGLIAQREKLEDPVNKIYVRSENFGAAYFLATSRTSYISCYNIPVYVTQHGVFRTEDEPHPKGMSYILKARNDFSVRNSWINMGGASMDAATSEKMLRELSDILYEHDDPAADVADAYLTEYILSEEYNNITKENTAQIPDSIKELAAAVTAEAGCDAEKAVMLERYFLDNGFVYDLRYRAPDNSVEYFLFESKRGTCSDYATAFALMARSLGLKVRYAEGYTCDITVDENNYVIRDSTSHAFPEVFIENMGWCTFEPTMAIAVIGNREDDNVGGFDISIDFELVYITCAVCAVILIVMLLVLFAAPVVNEKIFLSKAAKADVSECAVMLYSRFNEVHFSKIAKYPKAYTPYEAACRMDNMTDCDITPITYAVEETVYAQNSITGRSQQELISCYKQAADAIKNYKRQKAKDERNRRK